MCIIWEKQIILRDVEHDQFLKPQKYHAVLAQQCVSRVCQEMSDKAIKIVEKITAIKIEKENGVGTYLNTFLAAVQDQETVRLKTTAQNKFSEETLRHRQSSFVSLYRAAKWRETHTSFQGRKKLIHWIPNPNYK